jgi:WD40 repeat protein
VLPDGRLASGGSDKTIHLRDLGRIPESARLETIRLWNVRSGAETARLQGHGGVIAALAVLPDGRLASGGYDRTIRLWDVVSGQELARLEADTNIRCLLSLPDGRLIAGDMLGRLHWLEIVD